MTRTRVKEPSLTIADGAGDNHTLSGTSGADNFAADSDDSIIRNASDNPDGTTGIAADDSRGNTPSQTAGSSHRAARISDLSPERAPTNIGPPPAHCTSAEGGEYKPGPADAALAHDLVRIICPAFGPFAVSADLLPGTPVQGTR